MINEDLDVIGDIHGHFEELVYLLKLLGYRDVGGCWRHPFRKILFLGDFIDRGPNQVEVVKLVMDMVFHDQAYCVLGNHELNACAMFTDNPYNKKDKLRTVLGEKGKNNISMHQSFIDQCTIFPGIRAEFCNFFLELPLWIDGGKWRAVHACWHNDSIEFIKNKIKGNIIGKRYLIESALKPEIINGTLYDAVEKVCKGLEYKLPKDFSYYDANGILRRKTRVKWWNNKNFFV